MTVVIHAGWDGYSLYVIAGFLYTGARVRELIRGDFKTAIREFANEKFVILCDGTRPEVVPEVYKYMRVANVRVRAIGTSQFETPEGMADAKGEDIDMLPYILEHPDHSKFPVGLYLNRLLTPTRTEAEIHDVLIGYGAENTVKELFVAGHMDMSPRTRARVSYFDVKRSMNSSSYDDTKVYPPSTLTTHLGRALVSPFVMIIALLVGIFWSVGQIWGTPGDIPEPSSLAWKLLRNYKAAKKDKRNDPPPVEVPEVKPEAEADDDVPLTRLPRANKKKKKVFRSSSCKRFSVKLTGVLMNFLAFPFILLIHGMFWTIGNSFYTFIRSGSLSEVVKETQVIVVSGFRHLDERWIAMRWYSYPVAPWYKHPRGIRDESVIIQGRNSHLPTSNPHQPNTSSHPAKSALKPQKEVQGVVLEKQQSILETTETPVVKEMTHFTTRPSLAPSKFKEIYPEGNHEWDSEDENNNNNNNNNQSRNVKNNNNTTFYVNKESPRNNKNSFTQHQTPSLIGQKTGEKLHNNTVYGRQEDVLETGGRRW